MTIRFAAPPSALAPRMDARQARAASGVAVNDNGGSGATDAVLDAALRHFAEHGLAAAQLARRQAEAALLAADRPDYQWWLGICRALDRTMARELDATAARGAD